MKEIKKISKPLTELPSPSSISFLWNFGFLLGILLTLQIISGVILSINFIQSEAEAFLSIVHIIRDSNRGWINRFIHSNIASLFFIRLIIHISRGIFYYSHQRKKETWLRGSSIFAVSIATAFFGYVLPWGQISYWGATVITNIVSAIPYIGKRLVEWLWGNFSVRQPTLNRFFSIHFLLPFIILALVLDHIILLHKTGSSNPLGTKEDIDKIEFHVSFTNKDSIFLTLVTIVLITVISNNPNLFIDPENINEANPMKAPVHIQPEWYFLFAYAILRSIPSKLGGIIALAFSILVIFVIPIKPNNKNRKKFSPWKKTFYSIFTLSFLILTIIGRKPVEDPYVIVGKTFRVVYFTSIVL